MGVLCGLCVVCVCKYMSLLHYITLNYIFTITFNISSITKLELISDQYSELVLGAMSLAALEAIDQGKSQARPDVVAEIMMSE